jgi:hypothetical protein
MNKINSLILISLLLVSCSGKERGNKTYKKDKAMAADSLKQYGNNKDFLKKHIPVVELKNRKSALILVPAWQGRVMTSTSEGDRGYSFGWINRDLIASGKILKHINPFGG